MSKRERDRGTETKRKRQREWERTRERTLLWQVWTHFKGQRNFKEWSLNSLSPKELKKLVLTSQRETLLDYFVCFKFGTINSISNPGSRYPSHPIPSVLILFPPPLIARVFQRLRRGEHILNTKEAGGKGTVQGLSAVWSQRTSGLRSPKGNAKTTVHELAACWIQAEGGGERACRGLSALGPSWQMCLSPLIGPAGLSILW